MVEAHTQHCEIRGDTGEPISNWQHWARPRAAKNPTGMGWGSPYTRLGGTEEENESFLEHGAASLLVKPQQYPCLTQPVYHQ